MSNWQSISIRDAPENVTVLTKIDDKDGERNVQTLRRQGSLWWYPDMTMYVYYRPTHWAPVALAAPPVGPEMPTAVSAETQKALDDIDANIRAAHLQMNNVVMD